MLGKLYWLNHWTIIYWLIELYFIDACFQACVHVNSNHTGVLFTDDEDIKRERGNVLMKMCYV